MHTAGILTQGKPNTDGQVFIGASSIYGSAQVNMGPSNVAGPWQPKIVNVNGIPIEVIQFLGAGLNFNITFNLDFGIRRTGMLQTGNFATNISQEAFGTKAAVPGPSAVPGTSGPSGFGGDQVIPPVITSRLPTIASSTAGVQPKGVQVNWIDFIYQVVTAAPTAINLVFAEDIYPPGLNARPIENSLGFLALAGAQLATTTANMLRRARLTPSTTPAMITDDCSKLFAGFSGTSAASSIVNLVGAVAGINYNYN
jgi:hypothetical protein